MQQQVAPPAPLPPPPPQPVPTQGHLAAASMQMMSRVQQSGQLASNTVGAIPLYCGMCRSYGCQCFYASANAGTHPSAAHIPPSPGAGTGLFVCPVFFLLLNIKQPKFTFLLFTQLNLLKDILYLKVGVSWARFYRVPNK